MAPEGETHLMEPSLRIEISGGDQFVSAEKRPGEVFSIGRDGGCDLTIDDPRNQVSRRHAEVSWEDGGFKLTVLGAAGVQIAAGAHLEQGTAVTLEDGLQIDLPGFRLVVAIGSAAAPEIAPQLNEPEAEVADPGHGQEQAAEVSATLLETGFGADTNASKMAKDVPSNEHAPTLEIDHAEDQEMAANQELSSLQSDPPEDDVPYPFFGQDMPGAPAVAIGQAGQGAQPGLGEGVPLPPWSKDVAIFRVPRTMWTESAERAEFRLAADSSLTDEMRTRIERSMVGYGHRMDEHGIAQMGTRMRAVLYGDSRFFRIEALGPEVQDIKGTEILGWVWRVVPVRDGHSLLTLRISMLEDANGTELAVDAQALHASVEVTVRSFWTRPRRFVRDHWKWILASSGIGAAAAILALFRI
ncbi:MAG: FHA domain-containing protein [Pseudomonadota bacterium]